jgi:hypothetical protein
MSRYVLALLASSLLLPAAATAAEPPVPASSVEAPASWVFFADHGSPAAKASAVRDAEQALLHPRRLERLRRVNPGGPWIQENDLAVERQYVSAVEALGASVRQRSRWMNAVSVTASPAALEAIARLPFVREVRRVAGWTLDRPETTGPSPAPARPFEDTRARFYGPSITQLALIRADALQDSGYTGEGIMIAMLDSGFKKSHPAFATTNLVAEHDFVKNDGNTENQQNDDISQHGHGTGTWAVVGGYAPGSLIGFAPFADFVLAKTEDVLHEAHIEEDNWVAAAEWADSLGASIISASLAYRIFDAPQASYDYGDLDGHTTIVALGAREAIRRGIVVVTAMGNEGNFPETLWSPADADSAVSVGAVDSNGLIANFSSNGPTADGQTKPEVCALGVSTIWAAAQTNGYGPASGTSLSTPCVGGGVALLLEAHPTWAPGNVLAALRASSDRSDIPDNAFGYGVPDLARASYFGGSRAPAQRPWPFALVSPAGQTVDGCRPTFVWRRSRYGSSGAVTYRLEVDDDPQFTSPFVVSGITDTTYTPAQALPVSGQLSWRVTAVGPNAKERAAYFTETVTLRGAALSVGLESPPAGAALAAVPEFRWRFPTGADRDSSHFALIYATNAALTGAVRIEVGNDTTCTPALPLPLETTTYYWRVEATDPTQCGFGTSSVRSFYYLPANIPDAPLSAPQPNPFGLTTLIPIVVPGSSNAVRITVGVFDSDGRLVRMLVDGDVTPGPQYLPWDGSDADGRDVPSGVYYVRLESSTGSFEQKIVRIR